MGVFEDAEREQLRLAWAPLKEVVKDVWCPLYQKYVPIRKGRCLCGEIVQHGKQEIRKPSKRKDCSFDDMPGNKHHGICRP